MRQLSFQALRFMDGAEVIVHDLEYDAYDQTCIVCVDKVIVKKRYRSKKIDAVVNGISLKNEEFLYQYDWEGNCVNGNFIVYGS